MDSQIRARVQSSFSRQTVMATIGAAITQIEQGAVTIELPFRSDLCQQHGFVHAGILTMLVDTACGYAALTLMPPTAAVLTVEFKTNFMSPAIGEKFIARGRVLKAGRTLSVCYGEVHAYADGQEKLIATMLATMIAREDTGLVG